MWTRELGKDQIHTALAAEAHHHFVSGVREGSGLWDSGLAGMGPALGREGHASESAL